jgi:hypothetical protein
MPMHERARTIRVEPVFEPPPEALVRLQRLRRVAWWMERAIPIGGRFRVGLDPLIGLIPGLGDWIGAGVSLWMIYEAIRLGIPLPVLARMGLNVAVEAAFGSIPVLGDVFDAAWQANQRNYALVERHYDARLRPRSARWIGVAFALAATCFLAAFVGLVLLIAWGIRWLLTAPSAS